MNFSAVEFKEKANFGIYLVHSSEDRIAAKYELQLTELPLIMHFKSQSIKNPIDPDDYKYPKKCFREFANYDEMKNYIKKLLNLNV